MMSYLHTIKITESMDRMLKAIREERPDATVQAIWEEGLVAEYCRQGRRKQAKDGRFKPCPMCGEELHMKDVRFMDEEGCDCEYISNQLVEAVGIFCDCGYRYVTEIENVYDELDDLQEGGRWERNFIALANRRYKAVE